MEDKIPAKSDVEIVGEYNPSPFGIGTFRQGMMPASLKWPTLPADTTSSGSVDTCVDLFNGRNLSGWDGNANHWTVENGVIVGRIRPGQTLAKNICLVWTGGDVSDFELRGEFWIEGGNSGIQYRSKVTQPHTMTGYQFDLDVGHKFTGCLYEEMETRQVMARAGESVAFDASGKKSVSPLTGATEAIRSIRSQWNDFSITARGNRLTHSINGTVVVDVTDDETKAAAASGRLGLQLHSGGPMTVRFRNLRPLK